METRKIIITSILTTLATMLVVAVIMHLCCGNCGGRSSCSKAKIECSSGATDCKKSADCKSKCEKGEKSCKSKCEKGEKTMEMEWTSEDGTKEVKKTIEVTVDEKK